MEDKRNKVDHANCAFLPRNSNQALGIARFAIDFVKGQGTPAKEVLERVELFHTDAVLCGLSALALRTNSPTVLRDEALTYHAPSADEGAMVFGARVPVRVEKAILANCAAVREWDTNGTVFGYNKKLGHTAGEFGHNDYYSVAVAAAQLKKLDGKAALRGMLLIDEIRGRLAEVFSLKSYKIDHVVHGAIASAATFGAMVGATAEQIESALGMCVAHYIPFRAIRAGHQLSDSKGASAAVSTEVAILSVLRSMRGFVGPKDIFRNPEAIFRLNEKTAGDQHSPFDLVLTHSGSDFAVMGMHFKLGLYEHQSAGALQGLVDLLLKAPHLADAPERNIASIKVLAYQPAFGIIGDPAKRDPHTRQSADHSMVFILAAMLNKAAQLYRNSSKGNNNISSSSKNESDGSAGARAVQFPTTNDEMWKALMLTPHDYSDRALFDATTRKLMSLIEFEHGGKEYDLRYPEGIPTSLVITTTTTTTTGGSNGSSNTKYDSGLIMFPAGHARNTSANLEDILARKFQMLACYVNARDPGSLVKRFHRRLAHLDAAQLRALYDVPIEYCSPRSRL